MDQRSSSRISSSTASGSTSAVAAGLSAGSTDTAVPGAVVEMLGQQL
jgi:hypothetical protein